MDDVVYGLKPERIAAAAGAVLALVSAIIGGLALVRTGNRRGRAIVALLMGEIGLVIGGFVAATADGGVGTGNGIAGAVVAMVIGLIGTTLGGIALVRSDVRSSRSV